MKSRVLLAVISVVLVSTSQANAQAVRLTIAKPAKMSLVQQTQNISCTTNCETFGSFRGQCELWKQKNCKK